MKKTALQMCSLAGLMVLILLVVASTNAQTQYRAHVPFKFTINQKSYEAGDYSIDVLNTNSALKPLAVRDAKGRNSQILMMTPGEDYSKVEIPTLVFRWNETEYSLAAVKTPSFIVKLATPKTKENLARNQNPQERLVALTKKN